jgi:hypothetical protein
MEIKSFSDKILFSDKRDVLRVHLYTKLIQNGIKPFENDIDILLELYLFGGYRNVEEQSNFLKICLDKKLRKNPQSIRNTLSKYTNLKVLDKPRNTVLRINNEFIPKVSFDKLVLQHIVSHKN